MAKRFRLLFFALMAVALFALAACGATEEEGNEEPAAEETEETTEGAEEEEQEEQVAEGTGELVVYSSRNEDFVNALLEKFEQDTGITVQPLHAGDNAVNRIKGEAGNVQADIFISNDIGALEHLRLEGLLEGSDPEGVESIDEKYRAEDNSWIALSARTRVLMYNKDLISEEEMPKTIEELTDPKWEGDFAITRGGNGGMIAHVSALRQELGDEETKEWISQVKDNAGAILEGHGDIRRAVGAGEFKFGLVNNYYYHQQLREPTDNNVGVIYPDQGDDEMGAVVNAAGVGLIKDAPNGENAQAFLEWILLPENQREFSFESLEVPINPEIEAPEGAATISDYKTHDMPLSKLGEVWEDTRELIEEAGLDLDL
ncbi:extracellular solute-binding protein [Halalkalibacterium halodurans]|uniref:Iron (III) transport system (Iron (III)-binding protein) n=2 Tax=Halalkalibacterium halodurans TaxID=86665 RepID=Q9KFG6_HALH5|nr:extracellular solute-binding protein [Halalkalibacterium halodurans]MDY7221010.1 extracellular solute-binding protein [Halalkalibacterium halodurans]MDY7240249.1 extracellular solute-binding protein [Halalkalibacterium halodurans]MED4079900.1 extracellular solute-binding protein [Halalkalibacterium halodurans]MED4085281.1 extracellular solute-binding protein [Halalkalibacterium halodurans]MED4103814.1 extracellular solute-binding protein [Halalkalibacterium halodurans]